MPASRARRAGPGAQAGRRVDLGKVEEKCGFLRPARKCIPPVPGCIVKRAAGSREREREIASGVRILRGEGNSAIEKLPRPPGAPLPEFLKRAADPGPGGEIAPRRPRGVRHEPQLTIVTHAGVGGGEEVIGALGTEVGIDAFGARATPIRPAAERLLDLSLRGRRRDAERSVMAGSRCLFIGSIGHFPKQDRCPGRPRSSEDPCGRRETAVFPEGARVAIRCSPWRHHRCAAPRKRPGLRREVLATIVRARQGGLGSGLWDRLG